MLLQRDMNGTTLSAAITELIGDPEKLSEMGMSARKLSRPDAVERVADLIEELRNNV